MFSQHHGGCIVDGGVYWSRRAMEFVPVPPSGGTLPGGNEDAYVRTPILLVLVLAPVMGLAFAMFLPLSGILAVGRIVGRGFVGAVAPSRTGRVAYAAAEAAAAGGAARQGSFAEDNKLIMMASEIVERRFQGR